ncbi:hypothetical protein BN873_980023 [Candidatus Competibacter denitrificans Run_A_D11]|uniref:Uncharacterized protein n=1 Tax=Candidatus Competibacter denitrificans Run_A_D11 TaxID=1400863 RepID=W6M9T8_9GAMM|nr:hypothetical protein BN873_980023 [Candidatus Competibacter denitrificans Run_A_D11]
MRVGLQPNPPPATTHCGLTQVLSGTLCIPNNGAADHHLLLARREAPQDQRMKPTSAVKAFSFSGFTAYPPPH